LGERMDGGEKSDQGSRRNVVGQQLIQKINIR